MNPSREGEKPIEGKGKICGQTLRTEVASNAGEGSPRVEVERMNGSRRSWGSTDSRAPWGERAHRF